MIVNLLKTHAILVYTVYRQRKRSHNMTIWRKIRLCFKCCYLIILRLFSGEFVSKKHTEVKNFSNIRSRSSSGVFMHWKQVLEKILTIHCWQTFFFTMLMKTYFIYISNNTDYLDISKVLSPNSAILRNNTIWLSASYCTLC